MTTEPETTHVPAGTGEALDVLGDLVTLKTVGADTGGAYAVWEDTVPPRGGPPPHVHHREDESFYVLEGEFEFFRQGEAPLRAAAGDWVRTPRGVAHTFTNVGQTTGRLLAVAVPAGMERFLAAVGRPVAAGEAPAPRAGPPPPEQVAHVVRTAQQYGVEIFAPPPPGE
jgi:mannose-6-phosphate isomerase-like protein (cupin superfamily)